MANKFYNHTVSDYYGQPALAEPDQFGIEIEMEGLPEGGINFPRVAGWTPQADGSLRNGIEFVSAGPRTIDQLTTDLPNLSQAFAGINFVPVFSYRTSLHVHANVRDLTWVQIANLWAIYTIFEMPLMEMGGEERIGNVHCQAVTDCHEVVDRFKRCFDDKAGKGGVLSPAQFDFNSRVQRLTNRDRRYASFNFASIPNFGTVEFRSHRGTMDTKTVLDWVQTIMAMKAAARVYPDPQWLVQDFSSKGPEGFAEHVFGPDHYVTQNINQFNSDIWEGLRLAQEVAFVRPAWDKAAKPAKKAKPKPEVQPVAAANNQRPGDYEMMPQHIRNRVNDNITLLNEINRMGRNGTLAPDWIANDYDRNLRAIQEWRNEQPAEGRQRRARNQAGGIFDEAVFAQAAQVLNRVQANGAGWRAAPQWNGDVPRWAIIDDVPPVAELPDDEDEDDI